MLKLTKTGIGLLTRLYRSVLHKCWAINVGIFALGAVVTVSDAEAAAGPGNCETYGGTYTNGFFDSNSTVDCYWRNKPEGLDTKFMCTRYGCGYYTYSDIPADGPYAPGDAGYGTAIAVSYSTYSADKLFSAENFESLSHVFDFLQINSQKSGGYVSSFATATGSNAIAIGQYAKANGDNSIAIGRNAVASSAKL